MIAGTTQNAPSTALTDAWLLDLAADELLARGWARYSLADKTGMCAVGAIVCAATGAPK